MLKNPSINTDFTLQKFIQKEKKREELLHSSLTSTEKFTCLKTNQHVKMPFEIMFSPREIKPEAKPPFLEE